MKKVCIDARMFYSAGIGTYVRDLLKNLKNSEFKIFLIVNEEIAKKETWLSEKFELIILNAPIYSIKEQILLPLKIPRCDLFFSPHFNVPILPIRAKKRMMTIHDVYHLAFFSKLKFLEKIYAKLFICKAALHADKIITVSEFSKSELLKYTKIKEAKIDVIHNGVDFDFLNTNITDEERENIFKKLNLPKKYFLFVGNFKPHKNLSNLIKAFEEIEKEFSDIFLVIVGKSKNLKNFIDVEKILNSNEVLEKKIKILSRVSGLELKVIYENAISLVFPSKYEGFGYPPLEAMSLKCPAIVSNRASMPEICSDAALYIEPQDYKSIYLAMKKMLEDKFFRKSLIEKGLNRIKSFTVDDFVKKHIDLMEKIL
ncbi:MAG: Glycogen synthase [Candidatus Anoxychlamydiales bacterium]|nr:Glycogen synthase [Candidatus Anoxychlamydiales bacterium]